MDEYPWPRLAPLPEAGAAAKTIVGLPNLHTEILPGWSQPALLLHTLITSRLPGATLRVKQKFATMRYMVSGGTQIVGYNVTGMPTSTLIDKVVENTCEPCGRPGRRREAPVGVWCDVCWHYRNTPEGSDSAEVPFEPRMPLTEEADIARTGLTANPNRHLVADHSLASIPPGWARMVASTLRHLAAGPARVRVSFRVRGDHLTMIPVDMAAADGWEFLVERLVASSRAVCQKCGHAVTDQFTSHPGVCDGCAWLAAVGWDLIPPYGDDGLPM